MNDMQAILLIAVVALVTSALRFLPFFWREKDTRKNYVFGESATLCDYGDVSGVLFEGNFFCAGAIRSSGIFWSRMCCVTSFVEKKHVG